MDAQKQGQERMQCGGPRAVVLLSGGQDSTTCLYWALAQGLIVYPIGFDYGQMHALELECARNIAGRIGLSYHVFDVRGLLAPSSLAGPEQGKHNEPSRYDSSLPASFTPGRNLLFLTIAASFAASVGARVIVTGVCQTDYSGYPDCRLETIDAMARALSLGVGVGPIFIETPLMHLSKAQTWKLAHELGCLDVIVNDTMTDYNGSQQMNVWGRGTLDNPASQLRAAGYFTAKREGWIP